MNKVVSVRKLIVALLLFSFQLSAQSMYLDDFPSECANATDQSPLPGHIIRLGFVAKASYGWSFFFPDQRIARNLQRVAIIENVGLIGQDLDEDLGGMIRARTPNGSFVIGQVFVGDEDQEPVVTCISRPILLNNYNPSYFGSEFSWLDRGSLGKWLGIRKFSTWNWRKWWGRDFHGIRDKYKEFYRHGRHNREYDRDKHSKDPQKWRKNNEGRTKPGRDVERRDDKRPDNELRKWRKSGENDVRPGRDLKRRDAKDLEKKFDSHQDRKESKKPAHVDERVDAGKKERDTKSSRGEIKSAVSQKSPSAKKQAGLLSQDEQIKKKGDKPKEEERK